MQPIIKVNVNCKLLEARVYIFFFCVYHITCYVVYDTVDIKSTFVWMNGLVSEYVDLKVWISKDLFWL